MKLGTEGIEIEDEKILLFINLGNIIWAPLMHEASGLLVNKLDKVLSLTKTSLVETGTS